MEPDVPPDPEYVAARKVLLDALEALGEHSKAVVVAGAQAIYMRAGPGVLPIADLTTDADLALDPTLLSPTPDLEAMLEAGGFEHIEHDGTPEPGSWQIETVLRGEEVKIPLDLIVPEGVSPGGRRGARLGAHGNRAARRSAGLEAALVENELIVVAALDPADHRTTESRVAGLPALLIAKSYKIHDRIEQGVEDRTYDKDASDIVRIMQSLAPALMASALAELRANPIAGDSTTLGMTYFEELFASRNGEGIAMAIRALRLAMPEQRVRGICLAYSSELRAAI